MKLINDIFYFSPSDLITYIESPFASWMEKSKLLDTSFQNFINPEDEMLKLLQKRGYQHENEYLTDLENKGQKIYKISSSTPEEMEKETIQAIEDGKFF